MAWRNCAASLTLLAEVNTRWPNRSKKSDGSIGDAAHATRRSDHNPWLVVDSMGVVRARDVDVDGIDAGWLAEHLRTLGAAGDRRLAGGGYVILNRRITKQDFSGWKTYTGTNPHISHLHVSFSRNRVGFDSTAPWGISAAAVTAAPVVQEDDLPSPADVWGHPIPDEYTPKGGDSLPAFAALGFALARATFALETVQRLETKLDKLAATVAGIAPPASGMSGVSEADIERIALKVLAELGRRVA